MAYLSGFSHRDISNFQPSPTLFSTHHTILLDAVGHRLVPQVFIPRQVDRFFSTAATAGKRKKKLHDPFQEIWIQILRPPFKVLSLSLWISSSLLFIVEKQMMTRSTRIFKKCIRLFFFSISPGQSSGTVYRLTKMDKCKKQFPTSTIGTDQHLIDDWSRRLRSSGPFDWFLAPRPVSIFFNFDSNGRKEGGTE